MRDGALRLRRAPALDAPAAAEVMRPRVSLRPGRAGVGRGRSELGLTRTWPAATRPWTRRSGRA